MESFEYISVLISVLLGLAITHLLVGIVSIIQDRESTQVYWVHLLWVVNTIVYITQFWWFIHMWEGLDSWTMSIFYLLFIYAFVLAACAGLLFPVRRSVANYRAFYYEHFRWFFACMFLVQCIDAVEVTVKSSVGLRPVPEEYFLLSAPMTLLLLAGVFVRNSKYHAILAPLMFIWNAAYAAVVFTVIN